MKACIKILGCEMTVLFYMAERLLMLPCPSLRFLMLLSAIVVLVGCVTLLCMSILDAKIVHMVLYDYLLTGIYLEIEMPFNCVSWHHQRCILRKILE